MAKPMRCIVWGRSGTVTQGTNLPAPWCQGSFGIYWRVVLDAPLPGQYGLSHWVHGSEIVWIR